VGLAPSTGTTLSSLVYFRSLVPILGPALLGSTEAVFPALVQHCVHSVFLVGVYPDGPSGADDVDRVNIITEHDQVVTPFTGQYFEAPNVTNVLLQDGCAADRSEHVSILYNERAWAALALLVYGSVVISLTMLKAFFVIGLLWVPEAQRGRSVEWVPFAQFRDAQSWFGPLFDALGNLAFFVPLGVLLFILVEHRARP